MSAEDRDNPFDLSAPVDPDAERGDHGGEPDDAEDVTADPSRFDATTLEELRAAGAEPREWRLSNDSSQRLDKYLQNRLKGISRNQVEKLIKIAAVTVNGRPAKKSAALREGDVVTVLVPPRPAVDIVGEDIPLDILFEDEHMLVVNKAAGIIVHPARKYRSGTMVNALVYHLAKKGEDTALSGTGTDNQRPGVVHRLDMNTTGVIIFAKQETTHGLLSKQFEFRTNLKCYLALVHGCPDPPQGVIDQPLGKHPTIREAHAVRHDETGRDSTTHYRVRRKYRGFSLVELELKSGRTHQIRVHLSHLGYPIVGDQLYGGETVGDAERADPPMAAGSRPLLNFARTKPEGQKIEAEVKVRIATGELVMGVPALHAALLRIKHPISEEPMTFTAPLHEPMLGTIASLEAESLIDGNVTKKGWHVDLHAALPGIDVEAKPRADHCDDGDTGEKGSKADLGWGQKL